MPGASFAVRTQVIATPKPSMAAMTDRPPTAPSRERRPAFFVRPLAAALLAFASVSPTAAPAQFGFGSSYRLTTPTDAVVERKLLAAEDAIAAERYADAVESLVEVLNQPADAYADGAYGDRRPDSMKSRAVALLDGLPPAGVEAFETRFGPAAAASLAAAERGELDDEAIDGAIATLRWSEAGRSLLDRELRRRLDAGRLADARDLPEQSGGTVAVANRIANARLRSQPRPFDTAFLPELGWRIDNTPRVNESANAAGRARTQVHPAGPRSVVVQWPDRSIAAVRDRDGSIRWTASDFGVAEASAGLRLRTAATSAGTVVASPLRFDERTVTTLYGFETETGRLRWLGGGSAALTTLAEGRSRPLAGAVVLSELRQHPVLADVFAIVRTGSAVKLVGLDPTSGELTIEQPLGDLSPEAPVTGVLVPLGRDLLVLVGDLMTRYSPIASRFRWREAGRYVTDYPSSRTTLGSGIEQAVVSPDRSVVLTLADGRVRATDASSGKIRWNRSLGAERVAVDDAGRLLAVTESGLAAFDVATGERSWDSPIRDGTPTAAGVVDAGRWAVPLAGGELLLVDPSDGRSIARVPSGIEGPFELVHAGGSLYAASRDVVLRYPLQQDVREWLRETNNTLGDGLSESKSDRLRLRAADLLQRDRASDAQRLLRLAPDDPEAVVLLIRATLDSDRDEVAAAEVLRRLELPESAPPDLARRWFRYLAQLDRDTGDLVGEFAALVSLAMVADSASREKVGTTRIVRSGRLTAARLRSIWEAANAQERSEMQETLARAYRQVNDVEGSLASLDALPLSLFDDGTVRQIADAEGIDAARRAELLLQLPGDLPDDLRPKPAQADAANWLLDPAVSRPVQLVNRSRIGPVTVESITDPRFGPPRLWRVGERGVAECLDSNGRRIAFVVLRDTATVGSTSIDVVRRYGKLSVITSRDRLLIVDESESEQRDGDTIWKAMSFKTGNSTSSAASLSPIAAGQVLFPVKSQIVAYELGRSRRDAWIVNLGRIPDAVGLDESYAVAVNGREAFVLDALTGAELARRQLPASLLQPTIDPATRTVTDANRAVFGRRLVLQDETSLKLFDPVDGQVEWTRAISPQAAIVRVDAESLLVCETSGRVTWFRLRDNRLLAAARVRATDRGRTSQAVVQQTTSGIVAVIGQAGGGFGQSRAALERIAVRFVRGKRTPIYAKRLPPAAWPTRVPPAWPGSLLLTDSTDGRDRATAIEMLSFETGEVVPLGVQLSYPTTLRWIVPSDDQVAIRFERTQLLLTRPNE